MGRVFRISPWKWRAEGGNRGNSQSEGRPFSGAGKPAQNAGSHISTATASSAVQFDKLPKSREKREILQILVQNPLFNSFIFTLDVRPGYLDLA